MKIDRSRLYDNRVVQRHIRAERVTKDEYAAWLADLPDVSHKIKPRDEGGDDDGFEQVAPKAEPAPALAPEAPVEAAVVPSPAQVPPGTID